MVVGDRTFEVEDAGALDSYAMVRVDGKVAPDGRWLGAVRYGDDIVTFMRAPIDAFIDDL
jgi:hypothetical protein